MIDAGCCDVAPAKAAHRDDAPPAFGSRITPALVAWAMVMGPRNGEETSLHLLTPDDAMLSENRVPHGHDQAEHTLYAGKRLQGASWPAGDWRAEIVIRRARAVIARRTEA